jgi:hypothetical protein
MLATVMPHQEVTPTKHGGVALVCGGLLIAMAALESGCSPAPPAKTEAKRSKAERQEPEAAEPAPEVIHKGPFGLSMISTSDRKPLAEGAFTENDECGGCHERILKELSGSMHAIAHTDPLYRATAELARKEAGQEVYAYCSGCHSPQGVTMGLIPDTPEEKLAEIAKAGILCDVCHQISSLSGVKGPWKEPGNASFVLHPDEDRKFGPPTGDDAAAEHTVETRKFLDSAEFCASCHTVIHPMNGVRIEHTYDEWKKSVYAEKGIQCQDCHMRSADDAIEVARKLEPIPKRGKSAVDGKERQIAPHEFVGGNINAALLGGSEAQQQDAEKRLQDAAEMKIEAPAKVGAAEKLKLDVVVTNVGAGHGLPTSLTELREMWVHLIVKDAGGRIVFESGKPGADGDIPEGTMVFGAHAHGADGKLTYKPWEVTGFLFKRLVPPKGTESETFEVGLPKGVKGPLNVEASLYYRRAPPKVARSLIGDLADKLRTVEMTTAKATVALED